MSQKTCGIPEACICGMCGKELAEPDYVDPETELKTLRAENSKLKAEREILRQAAGLEIVSTRRGEKEERDYTHYSLDEGL